MNLDVISKYRLKFFIAKTDETSNPPKPLYSFYTFMSFWIAMMHCLNSKPLLGLPGCESLRKYRTWVVFSVGAAGVALLFVTVVTKCVDLIGFSWNGEAPRGRFYSCL